MLTDWLALASYCLVMSGTPGPNNLMLTASGANHGFRGTLPHILGIHAGGGLQTFLCCLGLGALIQAWPALHQTVAMAGALTLLWLAWRLARTPVGDSKVRGRPLSFLQAAAFQAVNPKSWVKALTLGSVFMPAGFGAPGGAALVTGVGFLVGLPCLSAWAMFGVAIRRWLQRPGRQRAFNVMMAATLASLAVLLMPR